MSEGRSSALGDPGSLSHEDVGSWMSGTEDVDGWGFWAGSSVTALSIHHAIWNSM